MDILKKFREVGYFTADLYHLITQKKNAESDAPREIIPSEYLKEMRLSTTERLQKLNGVIIDNWNTQTKGGKPVLSFTPRIILFQNYKPNDKITAKFSVKNISNTTTYLNLVFKESLIFSIKPVSSELLSRLAPGISVTFMVTFLPTQYEDYGHRVSFFTDKDEYLVPLIGMGPRPIFDFPDEIEVPRTPIKVESSVPITIHNIGVVTAGFSVTTKWPYSVHPRSVFLKPTEKKEVKVSFKTMREGELRGALFITYETGETFIIKVKGSTFLVSIELEKAVVRFTDTYNTMVRQQTFKVTNNSKEVLTYVCMKNDCIIKDFEDKMKLATIFYDLKQSESVKYSKLVQYDVLSSTEHERVYTRIFYDEIQSLVADESLFFQDPHFSISPDKGKLWPNKTTELTITFSPKAIGDFSATAFLDIDGILDRLPLRMKGTSMPPDIFLTVETLDMTNVYINTKYSYEIVTINKGHINGEIEYKETPTLFGSVITVTPQIHCLRPGDKNTFTVSFFNSNQGPFFEELIFSIKDTDVIRKLYLKGEVIYPTLSFSIPCLDFGRVSIGVPKTLQVEIINESEVTIAANIKIASDGPEISSYTLEDCEASDQMHFEMAKWPKEFNIEPNKIELQGYARITVKVTLTANLVRAVSSSLDLELEKSNSSPITLPIIYEANVPYITPARDIKLRSCFIDYSYNYDITIQSNEFWGFFAIEPQDEKETLIVDVPIKRGIIRPNSTITLPATIMACALGQLQYTVKMNLFGLLEPIDICFVQGYGVRPIITCNPIFIQWGQVKLLTRSQKTLILCNDSPVPVRFHATLLNRDSRFEIFPNEGTIEPESETELTLDLYLIDANTYTNKALIQLEKVKDILVPLSATGVGTSIVIGPDRDHVDMKRHFTKIPLEYIVVMENCGTRLHCLEWVDKYKARASSKAAPKPEPAFFTLDPLTLKMQAGEKIQLKVTAMPTKVCTVQETWHLVGSVESVNKKELLLSCLFRAEFVEPKIIVSATQMEFQIDCGPYNEHYKITDILTIKNLSKLPLDMDINIRSPFAIVHRPDTYKIDPELEDMCSCISYPNTDIDEGCGTPCKPYIDFLTMKPIEPLRKEPLHFFEDIEKIKRAFNLTNSVDERLNDQEIMKLQIVFDVTKHHSMKSKTYNELLRLRFKGHKNKDAVKVIGKINYPNVLLLSSKIDFHCLLNGTIESQVFQIHNPTPLTVCFQFRWKKCNIVHLVMPEAQKIEYDIKKLRQKSFINVSAGTFADIIDVSGTTDIKPASMSSEINKETENKDLESKEFEDKEYENKESDIDKEPEDKSVPELSITVVDEVLDPRQEDMRMKIKIMKKIGPMLPPLDNLSTFQFAHKLKKKPPNDVRQININEIFQVIPHRGKLRPDELLHVHLMFMPKPNINVTAILECEVLGGPTEYLTVTGQSSDLIFDLNTQTLNFKIRSFHENATECLVIKNIAYVPLHYKTYLNEPVFENELFATILKTVPSEYRVEVDGEVKVAVVMRPGVLGYFHRMFVLQIGHLPHIPIEIYGWGVIPQVYLSLPRPGLSEMESGEIGYEAISTLTHEYLEAVKDIFSKGSAERLISPMTEMYFEDPDLQEGWHICSTWDGYPSTMDIDLAIERNLVVKHIKNRPDILNMYGNTTKLLPIPGFQTVPYLVDFGVVITGSTVLCTIEVVNYGPIASKLRFPKHTGLPFWLSIKLCGKLNAGEKGKIEISFTPVSSAFPESEQDFETTVGLEMSFGPSMSIKIKALCAVPYLKSNVEKIDFGFVRCGDKIIISIPLKNEGKPACIWYVTLKLKSPGPNPLVILDSSGKYEPGQGGWLSVSFKPTMEMTYNALLIFRFHMNPNKLIIPVVGNGVLPRVHVIGPQVSFPPTLPWAQTTELFFGLTNPCPFPIDVIVPHVDEKWQEEEEIYQLLNKYYNKPEELLVPAIKPGVWVPQQVLNFYRRFQTNVKKKEGPVDKRVTTKTGVKKGKSPKSQKSATKPEKDSSEKKKAKEYRSEAEIAADEIQNMKEEGIDPLNFNEIEVSVKDEPMEKTAKGVIIFLHGSPSEESGSKELAYSLGKNLKIPTISFDGCFVDALITSSCLAKDTILTTISECYDNIQHKETEEEDHHHKYLDNHDLIMKKLEVFASVKVTGTPRSKGQNDKKKSTQALTGVTGTNMALFPLEQIHELMTDYFGQDKFRLGFVVDSLASRVVKSPATVMTSVLQCKSSIQCIHLVLCHTDFYRYARACEEAQREAELLEEQQTKLRVYGPEEIETIVKDFEAMDDQEYEDADLELKNIFIQNGLDDRKLKYYMKRGMSPDTYYKKKDNMEKAAKGDIGTSDSRKKLTKKEEVKSKSSPEFSNMQAKFNEYTKNVYESLVTVANNWLLEECEVGYPLLNMAGFVGGATQKKSGRKPKSDNLGAVSDHSMLIMEKGFPLTLILRPQGPFKNAILHMFKSNPIIQAQLKSEAEDNVLERSQKRVEYSVLLPKTMPVVNIEEPLQWLFLAEKPIKKCVCNEITDFNLLDDLTQENVIAILSKWHCYCGRKLNESHHTLTTENHSTSFSRFVDTEEEGEEPYFNPLPLHSAPAEPVHGQRITFFPGDLMRCKYTFSPNEEGNFSNKYFLEVVGWPESKVDINVSGICDLPRLDNRPKKMFANFTRKTVEDEVYRSTYLDDMKKFEFGPIFIGLNRVYEETYSIDLKNSSLMQADIDIEYMGGEDVFDINKDFITLEPGGKEKVQIAAAPRTVGVHRALLLFCVKDNPEIVQVPIACTGVTPDVHILPLNKQIDYGKLLLYRREDDRFIIKNDSILPIMWKIRNAGDFKNFIISSTSGIIPRMDNQVVPITYIACNVGVINQLPLHIDIYDPLGRGEPMSSGTIFLSAECYDVMVECAFENVNENYLNFGNVKVNSTEYRDMYLLNRGKYNLYYKLKKVKNFPEPALLKSFEADPESGVLPPIQKLTAIEFSCIPTTSVNLTNVPAYICSLLDNSKEQVVVARFPIYVTIASFYNTFTLYPLGELNFHIIPVGNGVSRDVILNNTSKCPFNYSIIVPEAYQVPVDNIPQKAADSKTSAKNPAKIKVPPIKCGNFTIINEDNLLAPGMSRTIQIQFIATEAKKFVETIHFIVSDTCPAEAEGVPLKLVGTGAMPVLDFWNLANTFREHLVVKSLSTYHERETTPHCVFVEDAVTLNFYCVNVNTSYCGWIDLYNNGLVPCILAMKMYYQANTNQDIFSLDKYDMQIDPLMHKRLGIIFSPKALEEYRAVLEVNLKLLDDQHQTYKLCLIGEGVIPRILLLSPTLRQHKIAVLRFPVTCLGSVSNKTVTFKNISAVSASVNITVVQPRQERTVFWLQPVENCQHMVTEDINESDSNDEEKTSLMITLNPEDVAVVLIHFNPFSKGRNNCDIRFKIQDNPYEYFTVLCEAEAFIEDVILIGLKMLSMDIDVDSMSVRGEGTIVSSGSTTDSKKKTKSAPTNLRRSSKKGGIREGENLIPTLKYALDFEGCELCTAQKRSVVMLNNSEKVYKFSWEVSDNVVFKPCVGYISPAEEKDIEITFFSVRPVTIRREKLSCNLVAVSDNTLTISPKIATWDSRQVRTQFVHNAELSINERKEVPIEEEPLKPPESLGSLNIIILYSVVTEYSKYICSLPEEVTLQDTFIYEKRSFEFEVENIGLVPLKITWSFCVDDEYPAVIDQRPIKELVELPDGLIEGEPDDPNTAVVPYNNNASQDNNADPAIDKPTAACEEKTESKETLFSASVGRESVDTWFEMDLPFKIEPVRACLDPAEISNFKVIFCPLEAFDFKVRLQSNIDNLDPYDQNIQCKLMAKAVVPCVFLEMGKSDYLASGKRKTEGVALPPKTKVLEFNVLGEGCYKKSIQVINPTDSAYTFVIESEEDGESKPDYEKEFIPVHCNKLNGYVEGGTSTEVVFTFAPTGPGVTEAHYTFVLTKHDVTIPLLIVGIVREPNVTFSPKILVIRNTLVGFTTMNAVTLINNEDEQLNFKFSGTSINDEEGAVPVWTDPDIGVLPPHSETNILVSYTPLQDGPLSFKIFCEIQFMKNALTLCVNALSHLIKPTVIYYIVGNKHVLNHKVVTNIHLEQTASGYEREIPFIIKNEGSETFHYDWSYVNTPVKKYLTVSVEPEFGYLPPAEDVKCILKFHLKSVQVRDYPVTLSITNGPRYDIALFADIQKPKYHFSLREYDFGKCIIGAPEKTYKKNLGFTNDDKETLIFNVAFTNLPELFVDYQIEGSVEPKERVKIPIYFRPQGIKTYEFKLQFWVNSLCEEIVTIRGTGVPLLLNLYEGCKQTFNLGPLKVGDKLVRDFSVMNHTEVAVEASFFFEDMYGLTEGDPAGSEASSRCLDPNAPAAATHFSEISRVAQWRSYRDRLSQKQMEADTANALSSLKVLPSKMVIGPYRKGTVKIQFKPTGIINFLKVRLNAKVLEMVRPLVLLSGCATGMHFCFSQNSLQFGRVRKRGCKILKIKLQNKGDFNSKFWWQPLKTSEFTITPMRGHIAAHTDVTFAITYRPINYNPFVKVWASCNIHNYDSLEVEFYAACVDLGVAQNQSMYLECHARDKITEYLIVTNPTDETWLILSEVSGPAAASYETLREFNIEANSVFEIPIHFKPKTMGAHDATVLFSPLGESALFLTLVGTAVHPKPNDVIKITISARQTHTEFLLVHNITEHPESYLVTTELVAVSPDPFEGYYEIKYPDTVKVWGETSATCRWSMICFAPCDMVLKVMFINEETREYQFYELNVTVERSHIIGTLNFVSRARETVQKELVVTNPLEDSAEFHVFCEKILLDKVISIARNSEVKLSLSYSPLVVGEFEDYLLINNPLVGQYMYRVVMVCEPAKEKILQFSTTFGSCIPIRLRVHNRSDMNAHFLANVDHPSITLDKDYALPAFEKGKFNVWFEPTELGPQNVRVSFTSSVAGEFVIMGIGTEPKPQGPFQITPGGFTYIKLKNVFTDTRMFKIFVDREDFYVKSNIETIKSKAVLSVAVYLVDTPAGGWEEPPSGCLTIENFDPADPKVQWTYFLQGKS